MACKVEKKITYECDLCHDKINGSGYALVIGERRVFPFSETSKQVQFEAGAHICLKCMRAIEAYITPFRCQI